jgi:hypothetical protein
MTVIELERNSPLYSASTKNAPTISAFFIILYDAYAPEPFIIMLHVTAYKPLTGAVNIPENVLYPLPAFVSTVSNTEVWCLLGWSSPELMYA